MSERSEWTGRERKEYNRVNSYYSPAAGAAGGICGGGGKQRGTERQG